MLDQVPNLLLCQAPVQVKGVMTMSTLRIQVRTLLQRQAPGRVPWGVIHDAI
jgi:hypothetical protein